MPAKGKRVAARQAQLNRRRRRQARTDSEGEVTTAVQGGSTTAATIASPAATANATAAPSADTSQSQPAPAAVRPVTIASSQNRNAQPLAYTHLARELRRILILAGIVLVVLLGVSFVL